MRLVPAGEISLERARSRSSRGAARGRTRRARRTARAGAGSAPRRCRRPSAPAAGRPARRPDPARARRRVAPIAATMRSTRAGSFCGNDAERVAGQVRDGRAVERDVVMPRVLVRSRSGERDVAEMSAEEWLLRVACHARRRISQTPGLGKARAARDGATPAPARVEWRSARDPPCRGSRACA